MKQSLFVALSLLRVHQQTLTELTTANGALIALLEKSQPQLITDYRALLAELMLRERQPDNAQTLRVLDAAIREMADGGQN